MQRGPEKQFSRYDSTNFSAIIAELVNAATVGNTKAIKQIFADFTQSCLTTAEKLAQYRRLVNSKDQMGNIALSCAIINGHTRVVKLLFLYGADVNLIDSKGFKPLMYAPINSAMWDCLIEVGAVFDRFLEDALVEPIHKAAYEGDIAQLQAILQISPNKVNLANSSGLTPLFYAAYRCQLKTFDYLMQSGANPNQVSEDDLNLMNFSKGYQHNTFSKAIKARIGLSKEYLVKLGNDCRTLIKAQYQCALNANKKLLVILGESHGDYKLYQIEKRMLKVSKASGIHHFFDEYEDKAEGRLTTHIIAAALKMGIKVTGVDNHPNRECKEVPFLEERNKFMMKAIAAINQHGVLITGLNHLKGLLTQSVDNINRKKFHVVPFNLMRIYNNPVFDNAESAFASDPQNAIQVSMTGFSNPALALQQHNQPERSPAVSRCTFQ